MPSKTKNKTARLKARKPKAKKKTKPAVLKACRNCRRNRRPKIDVSKLDDDHLHLAAVMKQVGVKIDYDDHDPRDHDYNNAQ